MNKFYEDPLVYILVALVVLFGGSFLSRFF
jgi:hypothetical protein